MQKRVLITGIGGFMGSHVMRHLLENTDWEIVGLDSFRHRGKTDRINQQLEGHPEWRDRVTIVTHDLRAPISIQMRDRLGDINYILNIASESHVDRSIELPREFIENNVALMLTMLDYARKIYSHSSLEKFIHISTDEVFGPAPKGHNHKEGEPHKPSNPYSGSKAAQENICQSYRRTYNLPVVVTNTMNIIGELQDPEKFIPMIIQRIHRGEKVTIHASPTGEIGTRFYLHARNQADALMFILKNIDVPTYTEDPEMPRYNIVGEREVDNLELATLVALFAGKPLDYELVDFHSSRPGHDLRYALDGSKLASAGWKAPVPFEESLKRTVEWTLGHPEWLK